MRPETEPWWRQALADLEAAEANLRGGVFFVASWLSQQAAEKALKALYLERRATLPPRTHDLRMLAAQVGVSSTLRADVDLLVPIFDLKGYPTPAGVAPADAVTGSVARTHVEAARKVVQWVRNELGAPRPLPRSEARSSALLVVCETSAA